MQSQPSRFYKELSGLLKIHIAVDPLRRVVLDLLAHPQLLFWSRRPTRDVKDKTDEPLPEEFLWQGQYTHGWVRADVLNAKWVCGVWFTKDAGLTYFTCDDPFKPDVTGWRTPQPETLLRLEREHCADIKEMEHFHQYLRGSIGDPIQPTRALLKWFEICDKHQLIARMRDQRIRDGDNGALRAVANVPDDAGCTFAYVEGEWSDLNVYIFYSLETVRQELCEAERLVSVFCTA